MPSSATMPHSARGNAASGVPIWSFCSSELTARRRSEAGASHSRSRADAAGSCLRKVIRQAPSPAPRRSLRSKEPTVRSLPCCGRTAIAEGGIAEHSVPTDRKSQICKPVMNMADNVIPFQSGAGRESDRAQSQRDADKKQEVSDRLRAISMRKRLDERKMIDKASDRIRVAKNLGLILSELKTRGHSPEKILRDLRMGNENDSTKQLYNYVLTEGPAHEPDSKRVRVLTKTASKYLRIAECAAKAMGGDPDLIALRLFENTSYQVADDVPDEKIASMDQIRELLVGMAEAAIGMNDMAAYRELLESRRIGWDIDGTFGNYGSLPPSIFFLDRAARHVSYLGYAPTVLLYRRDAGPVTPIEGEAYQIDFEKDPDAVTHFLQENRPLPKKHRMPVPLYLTRDMVRYRPYGNGLYLHMEADIREAAFVSYPGTLRQRPLAACIQLRPHPSARFGDVERGSAVQVALAASVHAASPAS